ncbi:DUF6602 domain-containing protein [Mixta calida]|uniref:DUF6602 domain-containing protein n=1 Tax=Mixta calida TaxID=665913 RepID=UPI0034D7655F
MINEIIDIATKDLLSKTEFIQTITHPLEKGLHREYFVSEVLRPLLPHQYGITSGIIFDYKGNQSNQLDIIIFDKNKIPPMMIRDGAGLVPLDCALIVIEIKSMLTTNDYETSLCSATKLNPNFPDHLEMCGSNKGSNYPLYSIFAYKSDAANKSEHTRAQEAYNKLCQQGKLSPNNSLAASYTLPLISVLDKGFWGMIVIGGVKRETIRVTTDPLINMRNFIWLLFDQINATAKSRSDYNISEWYSIA